MLFRLALVTLLIACLAVGRLYASCMSTTFEWQIQHAKLVFAGTLTRAEAVKVPGSIVTRYRFDGVEYMKGQGPADSLILVQEGGCYGTDCIYTSVGISFQVGTRYVVFAYSGYRLPPGDYGPMPCGTGHPFAIRADSASMTSVVHFGEGSPIAEFDEGHMVIVGTRSWDPRHGGRSRPRTLSVDEVIRAADSELESKLVDEPPSSAEEIRNQLQFIHLYPHQDPGLRVTEENFLRTLSRIVRRVSDESDSTKEGR